MVFKWVGWRSRRSLWPQGAWRMPCRRSLSTTWPVAGGTLSYGGEGGALVGTHTGFHLVTGAATPANNGALLQCASCNLDFTTGANLTEGPVYT
jgi:hypothetical protein